MMKKIVILAALLGLTTASIRAAPLKLMPIDFVGEWCNGETFKDETNWKLPSWLDESDRKCTNILSVTKYEFSMVINKKSFSCYPDTIRQRSDTAPSGTAYMAIINAHCRILKDGVPDSTRGSPMTFEFNRYKGNINIKQK